MDIDEEEFDQRLGELLEMVTNQALSHNPLEWDEEVSIAKSELKKLVGL